MLIQKAMQTGILKYILQNNTDDSVIGFDSNALDWIFVLVASGSLYPKFWSPTVHFW